MKEDIMKLPFIALLLSLICHQNICTKSRLTFRYNHGRQGDVLLDYTKNFWIAYKNDLELYLLPEIPLAYIQQFHLYDEIPRLTGKRMPKMIPISQDSQIDSHHDNVFYVSQLYITIDGISDFNMWHQYMFKCSIEDATFGSAIRRHLTPKETFDCSFPENIKTVAMHVRKGGGFDFPLASLQYRPTHNTYKQNTPIDPKLFVDCSEPFKFPPEQYYVDQLIFLYHLLQDQSLYVYIFTDDPNPAQIANNIRQKIEEQHIFNIQFDYRKETNRHTLNIVKDIYLMSRFDYFIKSCSHFPWVSQMIGNHKVIISPDAYYWHDNYLDITQAHILIPDRKEHILHKINAIQENITKIRTILATIE